MGKQEELDSINQKWAKECTCSLRKEATQAVPGVGNPDAEILFIGEAPGKDEDLQGEPFVGAAGKFLNQMLEENGMVRGDVYITNVIKYRPPNNRDPLPEEVAACADWLVEQINLIEPKVIVLLGRHALERFFPGERISQVHGKLLKKKMQKIHVSNFFALYHPAAALYNGSMRDVLMEDFQKLKSMLQKKQLDGVEPSTPPTTETPATEEKSPQSQTHLF